MSQTQDELGRIFTLEEEYHALIKDKYGRFPHYMSKNRWIFEPVVSGYLYDQGFRPEYPSGKPFAVCLSHDVDILTKSKRQVLKETIKKTAAFKLMKAFLEARYLIGSKVYNEYNLLRIIDLEKKYQANSSFYFLAVKPGEEHFNYYLKKIIPLFSIIKNAGNEIGLHGGHETFQSELKIQSEKELLQKYTNAEISGFRNHYIRFDIRKTWNLLESNDFIYDTTLGFPGKAGFRNGMCYPFHPFDLHHKKFMKITELPLIIMDFTLFNYMKLDYENGMLLCRQFIDVVKKLNGVITIQWHNTNMTGESGEFYENLLKYLVEENAWLTSGINLINWWESRNYSSQLEKLLQKLI